MEFRGDKMCKRVLIADNTKEMGKIKILQTTDRIWIVLHIYL